MIFMTQEDLMGAGISLAEALERSAVTWENSMAVVTPLYKNVCAEGIML